MKKRIILLIILSLYALTNGIEIYYPELIGIGIKYSYYEYRMVKFDVDSKKSIYGKNFKLDNGIIDVVTFSNDKVLLVEENLNRDTYIYDFTKDTLKEIDWNVTAINKGVWVSFQNNKILVTTPLKEFCLNYPNGFESDRNRIVGSPWVVNTDSLIILYLKTYEKKWLLTVDANTMLTIENIIEFELPATSLIGGIYKKIEYSPDKKQIAIKIYDNDNPKNDVAVLDVGKFNVKYYGNIESFQWYSNTELIIREEYGDQLNVVNLKTGNRITIYESGCLSNNFYYNNNSIIDLCSKAVIDYIFYKAKFIRGDTSTGKNESVLVFKKNVGVYYRSLCWDWYK